MRISNGVFLKAFLFLTWLLRTWNSSKNSPACFAGLCSPLASLAVPWSRNLRRHSQPSVARSHSIAISSGTDALRFAIMACGVQPGDVVLTVPHTFIATTEAISQAGAIPEFVDIDEHTYNISVEMLQQFLEEQCTRR
jgi:dTDP-4-amino-4,6-dideoxygalactose transaminase